MSWDKFEIELWMNLTQQRAADQIKKRHADDESGGILSCLADTI
jgi:hypothetical protein